jgi:hypothetical protein
VAASTCGDIYRHALKNATAKRLQTQSSEGIEEGTGSSGEGVHEHNDLYQSIRMPAGCEHLQVGLGDQNTAEQFLASIDKELSALQELPSSELGEQLGHEPCESDEVPLCELISAECLDADARSGRPQVLSKAEKDRLITTVRQSWATRHMSLVELQLETGLGHVSKATILQVLNSQGIKAYIEECKFILDEDNKKKRMVSVKLHCTKNIPMTTANLNEHLGVVFHSAALDN